MGVDFVYETGFKTVHIPTNLFCHLKCIMDVSPCKLTYICVIHLQVYTYTVGKYAIIYFLCIHLVL